MAKNNKIIVRMVEKKQEGQFVVVEVKKNTLLEGAVVSVGEKVVTPVVVGDNILFSAYGYEELYEDGEKYALIEEDMVYAKRISE